MTVPDVFAPDGQKLAVAKERSGAVFLRGVESEKKGVRRSHEGSRKRPHEADAQLSNSKSGARTGLPQGSFIIV
ncbi:hypothetical protein SUTMEG_07130 [Sutterella megalosphaeroides]|uniref:Uncharacterized protein n=1 Tax=Sutterella megalosphaeroides TaxID=2494234 RepID=A0A2Z6I916_9BURK|nr:hypothetical protein SUTMEG_07130 [Sutterella megalosphaeroides]